MKPLHAFVLGTTFGALMAFSVEEALGHEWYDASCCSGRDCAPIAISNVHTLPEGFLIIIEPGEHPLVTERWEELIPYNSIKIKESQDMDFHVCMSFVTKQFLCLYVPPMGS